MTVWRVIYILEKGKHIVSLERERVVKLESYDIINLVSIYTKRQGPESPKPHINKQYILKIWNYPNKIYE